MESAAAFNGDGKEAASDEVRAPLPVKRDTLYGDATFMRYNMVLTCSGVFILNG